MLSDQELEMLEQKISQDLTDHLQTFVGKPVFPATYAQIEVTINHFFSRLHRMGVLRDSTPLVRVIPTDDGPDFLLQMLYSDLFNERIARDYLNG